MEKGNGGGTKGTGSSRGEGGGSSSGGAKGEHGSGTGGRWWQRYRCRQRKGNPAKGTCHIPDLRILHYPLKMAKRGLGCFESLGWSRGKVDSINVNKSSGYSRLDNAAQKPLKMVAVVQAFGLNLKYLSNSRLNKYLGLS